MYNPQSYYPASYTPMYQQNYQQQPQQSSGILWVQGEAAARSYLVGAGQSVLLMDSEQDRFYIKASDSSGMPQPLRIFEYTEKVANSGSSAVTGASQDLSLYVTREELEKRLAEIGGNADG